MTDYGEGSFVNPIRVFDDVIADRYTDVTAMIYQEIFFWCSYKYEHNVTTHYINGNYMMYDTVETLAKKLNKSKSAVEKALSILEKDDMILSVKPNKKEWYHRKWYTVTPKILTLNTHYRAYALYYFLYKKSDVIEKYSYINKDDVQKITKENKNNAYRKIKGLDTVKFTDSYTNISNTNISKSIIKNNNTESQAKACSSDPNENVNSDLGLSKIPKIEKKEKDKNPRMKKELVEFRNEKNVFLEPTKEKAPNPSPFPQNPKPFPYSEEQHKFTTGFLQVWADHKGTKHKAMPYGDTSNKTFNFILETLSNTAYDLVKFYHEGTWANNWIKQTGISEQSLEKAINNLGGSKSAFTYAVKAHLALIESKVPTVNFREVPKGFPAFMTSTRKDGMQVSWLLQHIMQPVTITKPLEYFFNTISKEELPGVYSMKDRYTEWMSKMFPKEQDQSKIIKWANYLYDFTTKLYELRPRTRYSTVDKSLTGILSYMSDKYVNNQGWLDRKPYHFTFGNTDNQKKFLADLPFMCTDFKDKVKEVQDMGRMNELPKYNYDK